MQFEYGLIALMAFVAFAPMAAEAYLGRLDLFNLRNGFVLYYFIQLGASALVSLLPNGTSEIGLSFVRYRFRYDEALIVATAGLCAFQIGYYQQHARPWRVPLLLLRPWKRARRWPVTSAFFLTGFLSFVQLLRINGGLSTFLQSREEWRAEGMVGQGYLLFPATSLLAIAALQFFITDARHDRFRHKLQVLGLYGAALFPAYLTGFRGPILIPVVQLIVAWNYSVRPLRAGRAIALAALILLGFTGYGLQRQLPHGVTVSAAAIRTELSASPELAYSVVARSRGTEVLAAEMERLSETHAFDYGWRGILEAVTIAIPHFVWPSKPLSSGERFTTYFFGDRLAWSRGGDRDVWGGVSPTAAGELYWYFGPIGVLLGMYFLGRLFRVTYATFRAYQRCDSVMLIYPILFTTSMIAAESLQGEANALVLSVIALIGTIALLSFDYSSKRSTAPVRQESSGAARP